jgi:hypothetical protein
MPTYAYHQFNPLVSHNRAGFPLKRQHRRALCGIRLYRPVRLKRACSGTIFQIMRICSGKADLGVAKTLKPVLCSSRDSVPVK